MCISTDGEDKMGSQVSIRSEKKSEFRVYFKKIYTSDKDIKGAKNVLWTLFNLRIQ